MAQTPKASQEGSGEESHPDMDSIREMLDALMGESKLATLAERNGEIVEVNENSPENDSPDTVVRVAFPDYPPIEARGDTLDEGTSATFYRTRNHADGYEILLDATHDGTTYGVEITMGVDFENFS